MNRVRLCNRTEQKTKQERKELQRQTLPERKAQKAHNRII
jgi:hypothetical protein